ncbi:MAG: M13-type metalloendopeptidase [Acidobacteriota bacterium]|nr:M13-type metalloendopeptidase [Acidobacteriota bacterium]
MKRVCICVMCFVLAACGQQASEEEVVLTGGIELANMDTSVRPQDDFFRYVNGSWLATTEIPADRNTTGVFMDLRDNAREDVKSIIEEVASETDLESGSDEQKVADLYSSFMDTERLEELGLSPLENQLTEIDGIADKNELSAYFAQQTLIGGGGPFEPYITVDAKNSTRYAAHLWQSGLGLPDRDYYFRDDERSAELRDEYVAHIEKMFALAGFDDPTGSAAMLMALETELAGYQWTRVENRDSEARYNLFAVDELGTLGDGLNWTVFLEAAGLGGEKDLVINQPSYIEGFNQVFQKTSVEDWKTFLRWNLLNNYASYLDAGIDEQNFDFYLRILEGQEEQRPRWQRGVDVVNGSLGEVVGKVYVSRYFPPEAKARMVELVSNLTAAYGEAIEGLDWMSPETKAAALVKLEKFTSKVGYPDRWEDYSGLEIVQGELVDNIERANEFVWNLDRSKLGGPIRDWEWGMTPQTVNAYYMPTMNEIVFPAAILQPPFFNMAADDAVNYGAIGVVIGHEMGHGFDDQGSRYDADGNLRNWWTEQDLEEFKERTGTLVDQFAEFEVLDGLYVNGELTLGENIGDLSGLTIAYRAYQISLDGHEAQVIDGFTGDQRFFLGIGQAWRFMATDEAIRNRVQTDPHSPPEFRVNGPLPNMPEFLVAFDVQEGDGMYLPPEQRVKIW